MAREYAPTALTGIRIEIHGDTLTLIAFDGQDLQIAFDPQYLLDGIGAINSDTARISFTSPTKPTVITGKTDHEPDYRYVLMPIRSVLARGDNPPEPPLRFVGAGRQTTTRLLSSEYPKYAALLPSESSRVRPHRRHQRRQEDPLADDRTLVHLHAGHRGRQPDRAAGADGLPAAARG